MDFFLILVILIPVITGLVINWLFDLRGIGVPVHSRPTKQKEQTVLDRVKAFLVKRGIGYEALDDSQDIIYTVDNIVYIVRSQYANILQLQLGFNTAQSKINEFGQLKIANQIVSDNPFVKMLVSDNGEAVLYSFEMLADTDKDIEKLLGMGMTALGRAVKQGQEIENEMLSQSLEKATPTSTPVDKPQNDSNRPTIGFTALRYHA